MNKMEEKKYLKDKIDAAEVVRKLYNFSDRGVTSIPDAMTRFGIEKLLKGIEAAKDLFWEAEKQEGKVRQEMRCLYLESADWTKLNEEFKKTISDFKKEYGKIYKRISSKAGFEKNEFNSIGIHVYPSSSEGITPHRDYAGDRDLISIFVLKGRGIFGVCSDRNKTDALELEATPGSLILMRAARNESEQKFRPFHYVEKVEDERCTLIVRRREKLGKISY